MLAALFAGLLGGAGGWLGATDRLNFGRLDRGPSPIPTVGSGATAAPGSIANIAARALPSVVTIKVTGADGNGTGSGFVIDEQGHIITNNHVVAGAGDDGAIKVQLSNGTEIEATIAGRDASYDLAVLKTGRTDLQPLTMRLVVRGRRRPGHRRRRAARPRQHRDHRHRQRPQPAGQPGRGR